MKKVIAIFVVLLATSTAFANLQFGVVVAVDKKSFTIEYPGCDKITFTYDPDMGKKAKGFVGWGQPLGVTADKIKVGMIVEVTYTSEKGIKICQRAMVIVENLGSREIDFTPLLAKGKDKLPEFVLRIELQCRESLGSFQSQTLIIYFNEGASIKETRNIVKRVLSGRGSENPKLVSRLSIQGLSGVRKWKVTEVGEAKLLVESYRKNEKDEPVNAVEIEAKGLPKDRQPLVRLIDPRDPTKSLKTDTDEPRTPKKDRK